MSKLIKIEVGKNEYLLGFPTREDAKNAEIKGLDVTKPERLVSFTSKLFYTGLLAKQPDITEDEANQILERYIAEDGDVEEVTQFLTSEYVAFIKSPDGKKKKKKAKIVEM